MSKEKIIAQMRLQGRLQQVLEEIQSGYHNGWWHILETHSLDTLLIEFLGTERFLEISKASKENLFTNTPSILLYMVTIGGIPQKDGSIFFEGLKISLGRTGLIFSDGTYQYTDGDSACTSAPIARRRIGAKAWHDWY